MDVISYSFGLLIIITLVLVYFPIIFIRKMGGIQETLQRIENNTRKQ